MIFSWENGRQLVSMTKDNKTTSYTYDISGMRTQKNVDGTVTKYYYGDSNNLVSMVVGDRKLMFYYDQNGSVNSVLYGGTRYYYVKNLQGDITMLVDENGSVAAKYTYDHQGAVVSVLRGNGAPTTDPYHIANLNPLRYRGYVYDTDSGLYYLQSRYYDPDTGRFINADVYCDTGNSVLSTNMFAYCENNPVNFVDPSGTDAWWLQDIDGVFYMGHTSLLIQERPGRWWYFYWGDKSIQLIYIGTCTLKSLNKYLNDNGYYSGTYDVYIKLKGDFYQSLTYIYYELLHWSPPFGLSRKCIINANNPNYNLISSNCMQMSIRALLRGDFGKGDRTYKRILSLYSLQPIPNVSYNSLLFFNNVAVPMYGLSYAYFILSQKFIQTYLRPVII